VKPVLRKARRSDIPALLAIEHASFNDDNWRADDFAEEECVVAEVDGAVVGFLVSRETYPGDGKDPPEREIINLAVAPAFRRMGIGKLLLKRELKHRAVLFLEVRESNLAAQKLYSSFGFQEVGRRPKFYANPAETAIVMRMK
jgi:ribosomal-protein-alanine N-acetyltransferase